MKTIMYIELFRVWEGLGCRAFRALGGLEYRVPCIGILMELHFAVNAACEF